MQRNTIYCFLLLGYLYIGNYSFSCPALKILVDNVHHSLLKTEDSCLLKFVINYFVAKKHIGSEKFSILELSLFSAPVTNLEEGRLSFPLFSWLHLKKKIVEHDLEAEKLSPPASSSSRKDGGKARVVLSLEQYLSV